MSQSLFPIRFRKKNKPNALLIQKNQSGMSLLPLDLCLRRGVISEEMHCAAQWFISLYHIRYGKRRLTMHYPSTLQSKRYKENHEEYQEHKNILFKEIMHHLQQSGSYQIIVDVCIFDLCPMFLKRVDSNLARKEYQLFKEYNLLINGLNDLIKLALHTSSKKSNRLCF